MEVLTAVLAFAGAALGSASAIAPRCGQPGSSATRAGARNGVVGSPRRMTAVTASHPRQVATGNALLRQLLRSDLATEEDRNEARAVLEVVATQQGFGDLRLVVPPEHLDEAEIVEDTGIEEPTEGEDSMTRTIVVSHLQVEAAKTVIEIAGGPDKRRPAHRQDRCGQAAQARPARQSA